MTERLANLSYIAEWTCEKCEDITWKAPYNEPISCFSCEGPGVTDCTDEDVREALEGLSWL